MRPLKLRLCLRLPTALVACVCLAFIVPRAGFGQAYPDRPVRLINPNPAGATADFLARAVADELSKGLGQTVFVENRPGAGSTIGTEAGAKSAPDGYTLMITSSPLFGVVPLLYSRLSFDPFKDFSSVMVLATFNNVIIVHPDLKAQTLKDLMALARAEPGRLTYGSTGNGTTTHLSGELFKYKTGIQITHVPYKGAPPGLNDLLGGRLSMMFINIPAALPLVKAGKLRALAVTGVRREASLPDVPTVDEAGVQGYQADGWFSLSVPSGTPKPVIAKVNGILAQAMKTKEFSSRIVDLGFGVVGGTPEQMDEMIKVEVERWAPVVKASGARID